MTQNSTDNSGSWFTILGSDTSHQHPLDGMGGKTATAASSALARSCRCILMGIRATGGASPSTATTLTIAAQDGSTALITFPIPIIAAATSILILPPVLEGGLSINTKSGQTSAGISAFCTPSATNLTLDIVYRDTGW